MFYSHLFYDSIKKLFSKKDGDILFKFFKNNRFYDIIIARKGL